MNFEFTLIVPGMNSVPQETGYTVAWTAPEILERANMITREADVFAFGMVVIEVGPLALPHLMSEVGGLANI